MKLSENQELVQILSQILQEYRGLDYDELSSARTDNILMVKVSSEAKCDISTAGIIARTLSEFTGEQYKVQPRAGSGTSTLDNLRGFGLFQFMLCRIKMFE